MRILTLSAVVLAGSLCAQGAGPGVIIKTRVSKAFTYANMTGTGTNISQISLVKMLNDPAGTWTACVTMANLATKFGGTGGRGVLMGKWDSAKDTFTPTLTANSFNAASTPFGLMVEPWRGLIAVTDLPTQVATRSIFTQPFGKPIPIVGLAGGTDPAVGYVGGKLKLFWLDSVGSQQGIVMQDFDATTGMRSGTPVLVSNNIGGTAHSPTPILGSDGEVEGLWLADLAGSDSDMYFANDLDPKTPIFRVEDNTGWSNNGGIAGGTLFWAGAPNGGTGASETAVAWLLGDVEKVGGKIDMTAAVSATIPPAAITATFVSDKVIAPLQIPGIGGALGLNPAVLQPLGNIVHTTPTQRGTLSFQLPNDPTLKGVHAPIQGVSIVLGKLTFTNTAWLTIL